MNDCQLGIGEIIVFNWLRKKIKAKEEERARLENEWFRKKSTLMEKILGKEHDVVMHAIIPYDVGGPLDLYYFPNSAKGTGIATKELTFACRKSSKNLKYSKYELVMFTRVSLELDAAMDETTPFGKEHENISAILNRIARYSAGSVLNPSETCEFPRNMEKVGGKSLIFDSYEPEGVEPNDMNFGMMLIMEIFRDEMEFAIKNGGATLLTKLKEKGVYPYSDLNRPSVLAE